ILPFAVPGRCRKPEPCHPKHRTRRYECAIDSSGHADACDSKEGRQNSCKLNWCTHIESPVSLLEGAIRPGENTKGLPMMRIYRASRLRRLMDSEASRGRDPLRSWSRSDCECQSYVNLKQEPICSLLIKRE